MATIPSISNVASTISAGNFASNLAVNTGGLSSIKTSLDGIKTPAIPAIPDPSSLAGDLTKKTLDGINPSSLLDKAKTVTIAPPEGLAGVADAAKGISGSAFSAISGSMKPLAAGVPQNLTSIAKKNAEVQAAADAPGGLASAASSAASAASAASSAAGGLTGGLTAAAGGLASAASSAAGGLTGGLTAAAGGLTGSASSLASGISNLPGGQSTIASVVNKNTGSLSGVTDTLSSVNSITKTASSSALNKISSATAGSSAAASLLAGGALTGVGAAAAGVLTNPAGSLPGVPKLPPDVPGVPSVDSLTKGLQAGKQPLSALASTGLPAGAAAALSASMNSLSTSSPFPIKIPTVAESTVDRGELNASVGTLLGDKKIPTPNFGGGVSAAATGALQAVNDRRSKLEQFEEERKVIYAKQKAITEVARAAYLKADTTLPEGDPEIDKLGLIFIAEAKKSIAILDETSAGRQAILGG